MIYLDHGATSFPKPERVRRAVLRAIEDCGNPGRGGYEAAALAERSVYHCREAAGALFACRPEQVVMTGSCTQGLNIAIRSLFHRGDRVLITGFEHNAVTRTLRGLGIQPVIAGKKLFDWEDTLTQWEKALKTGVRGAVFTQVSNVFGYMLPVGQMAQLLKKRGLPFVIDAAQSAGMMEVNFSKLGADYIAMPGHKGLLGPMGTGLLLCKGAAEPLLFGGTGSISREQTMPDFLPDALEAGTLNVPGIAGLGEGIRIVREEGPEIIGAREAEQARNAGIGLRKLGMRVFLGEHQSGTISFLPEGDCEELAGKLAQQGIALRAGLHCAPLAHSSAGTLKSGTLRASFGRNADFAQTQALLQAVSKGTGRIS